MLEADETIMRMCKDPAGYCLFVQILDSAAPQTFLRDNVSEISKKKKRPFSQTSTKRRTFAL